MKAGAALLLLLAAGCSRQPAPVAAMHYVIGGGYQAGGTWFYPREDFHYDATGLATVLPSRRGLTADGEVADVSAMVAAHQTLQLPCIAEVTNLDSGLQVLVRINDRGPASPSRLIAVSRRVAELLGVPPSGTARVRVRVDEGASAALRDQLLGGARLEVLAAPRAAVTAEALSPPAGVALSGRGRVARPVAAVTPAAVAVERVPDRLPETVRRVGAAPGQLMIEAGVFGQAVYAQRVAAKVGAVVERVREGRAERYAVRAGPYATVAAADAALDVALRAGVSDARIVVR